MNDEVSKPAVAVRLQRPVGRLDPERLEIKEVRQRFWWPHPYADGLLWRNVVVGFTYWIDGKFVGDNLLALLDL